MPNPPKVTLRLVDAADQPISQPCDVMLWNQITGEHLVAHAPKSSVVNVPLKGAPEGIYRIQVDPAAYLASGAFVSVAASGATKLTVLLAIDPAKVKNIKRPAFDALSADARRVLSETKALPNFPSLSGSELFGNLDDIRCAGFLNIIKKTEHTALLNGRIVATYIKGLIDLRGDRFFAAVSQELRDEAKHASVGGMFDEVSPLLHHQPAGFTHAGSFKTQDHYGNLQLTFFTNGTDWVADIDIDNANGLEHVFQVLHNQLTGKPTHPYSIHDILVAYQKLDPAYELEI